MSVESIMHSVQKIIHARDDAQRLALQLQDELNQYKQPDVGVEVLAQAFHNAGRGMVSPPTDPKHENQLLFIEWEMLPAAAKEGRRIQARALLQHYRIIPRSLPKEDGQ